MAAREALVLTLVGGGLTTLGTWLGIHWQAREGRRVRYEQYERDDRLRDITVRRDLYARFAFVTDEAIARWCEAQVAYGDHEAALASIKLCAGKLNRPGFRRGWVHIAEITLADSSRA
jgi:hypothetical protein